MCHLGSTTSHMEDQFVCLFSIWFINTSSVLSLGSIETSCGQEGSGQSAQMCRLIWTLLVTHVIKQVFWQPGPSAYWHCVQICTIYRDIPSSGCHKLHFDFDGCQGDTSNSITDLEHVELPIKLSAGRRGNIEIFLTSPSGTRSVMLQRRERDDKDEGIDFTFMTVHNWGEDPAGTWTLEVCDNPGTETKHKPKIGVLERWG